MSATRPRVLRMLALGAALLVAAGAAALVPSPASAAVYEAAPCPVEMPLAAGDDVRCGVLTVPERRTEGADAARTLRLPVVILPARSREPLLDPLVVPTSPGHGFGEMDALIASVDWARDERDVVVMEQRGGSYAEPSLACPELRLDAFVEDGRLLAGAERDARELRQAQACRDRLTEDGVDVSAYTTAASAADLADLRASLGYAQWNLGATGDATRTALAVLRDHADGIRSAVLDGPRPADADAALAHPVALFAAVDALMAECAADRACAAHHPDAAAALGRILDRAGRDPIAANVTSPLDGSPLSVTLGDADLVSGLDALMGRADAARALPFLLERVADGHDDALLPFVRRALAEPAPGAEGLRLSLACAEDVPFTDDTRRAEAIALDPRLAHAADPAHARELCAVWAVPPSDAARAPATGAVPVLLLTGGMDAAAPRAAAEAVAAHLPAARSVDVAHAGADVLWAPADGCATAVAARFLDDPATAPDAPCIGRGDPMAFLTAADVDATGAFAALSADLVDDRDPTQLALAGLTVLALATTLVYGIGYGFSWLGRRRGEAPEGAVFAASVAAGLQLAFTGAVAAIVLTADPLVVALGMPAAAWPLLLLPFVALIATVALIVLLVRAWRGGDGTTGHRVALSLAAAASVLFTTWLAARGLLML